MCISLGRKDPNVLVDLRGVEDIIFLCVLSEGVESWYSASVLLADLHIFRIGESIYLLEGYAGSERGRRCKLL
jgi:hypothetical protein